MPLGCPLALHPEGWNTKQLSAFTRRIASSPFGGDGVVRFRIVVISSHIVCMLVGFGKFAFDV